MTLPSATPGAGSRPLVVLVDDDPRVLHALERALRREPIELLATLRPAQVLRWICEREVALILSDQRMPDMEGTDLLEVVHDYSPETAFVILSGFPDTAVVVENSGLRIERLVAKPWDNDDLAATVRRILQDRPRGGVPRSADPPQEAVLVPVAPPPPGLQVKIDCSGRSAQAVIADILPICARARTRGQAPVIVLGNLPGLGDSVSRLLKLLARAVAWSHLPVDLRDESGCVSAFISALGRPSGRARAGSGEVNGPPRNGRPTGAPPDAGIRGAGQGRPREFRPYS